MKVSVRLCMTHHLISPNFMYKILRLKIHIFLGLATGIPHVSESFFLQNIDKGTKGWVFCLIIFYIGCLSTIKGMTAYSSNWQKDIEGGLIHDISVRLGTGSHWLLFYLFWFWNFYFFNWRTVIFGWYDILLPVNFPFSSQSYLDLKRFFCCSQLKKRLPKSLALKLLQLWRVRTPGPPLSYKHVIFSKARTTGCAVFSGSLLRFWLLTPYFLVWTISAALFKIFLWLPIISWTIPELQCWYINPLPTFTSLFWTSSWSPSIQHTGCFPESQISPFHPTSGL